MSSASPSDDPKGPPEDPREWKIFPRNLTARADYIVQGNPVTTRPEDGVDNCYPGLEMDAKNIQKYFFPGLYFDVYRSEGARLSGLLPAEEAKAWIKLGLKESDLKAGLYLWGLKGRNNALDGAPVDLLADLTGKEGLYAWRLINSLLPGETGVAIGPGAAESGAPLKAAMAALEAGHDHVERDDKGALAWATLHTQRASYLSDEGVLSPNVYEPGELTRTLCTPWTYDFRDCQCFYWASNKPDVVASEDGQYAYLNFQRKNRHVEPQTQDIAYGYTARREREIDYAQMMEDWEQLRPVLNGREFGTTYTPEKGPQGPLLDLQQIREEVTYLATVEHALAVQYLYAFYSIDVPRAEPDKADLRTFRLWHAARTIFDIAIDEMRHFRWANEIAKLIGGETTAARANMLGRNFKVPFYLQALSSPQLQWFIDIERPSRSTVAGLDGMYVGILNSLQNLKPNQLDPEKRRLAVETVKLIVDEGEGHYVRFSTAQQNFAFYDETGRSDVPAYLRGGPWRAGSAPSNPAVPYETLYGAPTQAPPGTPARTLQDQSDCIYRALLLLLRVAFALQDPQRSGPALRAAIALMLRMNDVNLDLAEDGAMPLFTLPDGWGMDPVTTEAEADALIAQAEKLLDQAPAAADTLARARPTASHGGPAAHDESVAEILAQFRKLVRNAAFAG